VKDLYNENYKALKKLEKILEDGKNSHIHASAKFENGHYYRKQNTDSMQFLSTFQ
jgi:CRISPR/Cas system Type II protein with McrA/HNH and RuvC-like nuclease domain